MESEAFSFLRSSYYQVATARQSLRHGGSKSGPESHLGVNIHTSVLTCRIHPQLQPQRAPPVHICFVPF